MFALLRGTFCHFLLLAHDGDFMPHLLNVVPILVPVKFPQLREGGAEAGRLVVLDLPEEIKVPEETVFNLAHLFQTEIMLGFDFGLSSRVSHCSMGRK